MSIEDIPIDQLSDEDLLRVFSEQEDLLRRTKKLVDFLKAQIVTRCEAVNATTMRGNGVTATLKPASPTYDHGLLRALFEVVTEDDWNKVYSPAFSKEVIVSERYDGRQLNRIRKEYGDPAIRIIDKAKIPGRLTLKVTTVAKEETPWFN